MQIRTVSQLRKELEELFSFNSFDLMNVRINGKK